MGHNVAYEIWNIPNKKIYNKILEVISKEWTIDEAYYNDECDNSIQFTGYESYSFSIELFLKEHNIKGPFDIGMNYLDEWDKEIVYGEDDKWQ